MNMNGSAIPYQISRFDMGMQNLSQGAPSFSNTNQWGMPSAILGNALGTNPTLPYGYSRDSYNDERQMVANHYMSGTAMAGVGFGASIMGQAAIWGKPVQALGTRMYGAGWNQTARAITGMATNANVLGAMSTATPLNSNAAIKVLGINRGATAPGFFGGKAPNVWSYSSPYAHTTRASSVLGGLTDSYAGLAKASAEFGSTVGRGVGGAFGKVAGATFEGGANLTAHLGGKVANWATGGEVSTFAKSARGVFTGLAESGTEAMQAFEKGSMAWRLSSAQVKAAKFLGSPIRGMTRTAGSLIARGGAAVGGFAGAMLNPLTLAEIWATGKAIDYGFNLYGQHATGNQLETDMLEKSDRILGYGNADNAKGLAGGFTAAQRARFKETVKTMAASSAASGDLFGGAIGGKWSPFGGLTGYSSKLKELKDIFNVGTDMGMFDSSKSFDEFEKKFSETVKVVKKMSKLIQKSKAEVMSLMGTTQQEGFLGNISELGNQVRRKVNTAAATGTDVRVVNMETKAVSEMFRQRGISAKTGSTYALNARNDLAVAKRNNLLSKEDIFSVTGQTGAAGESAFIVAQANTEASLLTNDVLLQTVATVMKDDGKGGLVVDEAAMKRLEASGTNRNLANREIRHRAEIASISGHSNFLNQDNVQGAALIDRVQQIKQGMREGKYSPEMLIDIQQKLIRQTAAAERGNNHGIDSKEALRLAYIRNGATPEMAKYMSSRDTGGFKDARTDMALAVKHQQIKTRQDNNRVGTVWGTVSGIMGSLIGGYGETAAERAEWAEKFYAFTAGGEDQEAAKQAYRRFRGDKSDELLTSKYTVQELRDSMAINLPSSEYANKVGKGVQAYTDVVDIMRQGAIDSQDSKQYGDLEASMRLSGIRAKGEDKRSLASYVSNLKRGDKGVKGFATSFRLAREALEGKATVLDKDNARKAGIVLSKMHAIGIAEARAAGNKELEIFRDQEYAKAMKNIKVKGQVGNVDLGNKSLELVQRMRDGLASNVAEQDNLDFMKYSWYDVSLDKEDLKGYNNEQLDDMLNTGGFGWNDFLTEDSLMSSKKRRVLAAKLARTTSGKDLKFINTLMSKQGRAFMKDSSQQTLVINGTEMTRDDILGKLQTSSLAGTSKGEREFYGLLSRGVRGEDVDFKGTEDIIKATNILHFSPIKAAAQKEAAKYLGQVDKSSMGVASKGVVSSLEEFYRIGGNKTQALKNLKKSASILGQADAEWKTGNEQFTKATGLDREDMMAFTKDKLTFKEALGTSVSGDLRDKITKMQTDAKGKGNIEGAMLKALQSQLIGKTLDKAVEEEAGKADKEGKLATIISKEGITADTMDKLYKASVILDRILGKIGYY